jgi:hypothetical protein
VAIGEGVSDRQERRDVIVLHIVPEIGSVSQNERQPSKAGRRQRARHRQRSFNEAGAMAVKPQNF